MAKIFEDDTHELRPVAVVEADDSGQAVYEGEWNKEENVIDGRGVKVWPDGSRYEGFWSDGEQHGYGRMIHLRGDVYSGQWAHSRANGYGRYSYAEEGMTYAGYWKDDT